MGDEGIENTAKTLGNSEIAGMCEAECKALVEQLKDSRRQLDEGEFTQYDDAGLTARFEELKAKAASSES